VHSSSQRPEVTGEAGSGWALPCVRFGILSIPPAEAGVWIESGQGGPGRPIRLGSLQNSPLTQRHSASLTGLLFSADIDVPVTDILDRHRPFVTWESHRALFRNAGTGWQWWHRFSAPKIHRTATSARCAARQPALTHLAFHPACNTSMNSASTGPRSPAHRKELCDRCFLDEPTSTVVSPREHWFTNRFTWHTLTATATRPTPLTTWSPSTHPTAPPGPSSPAGRPLSESHADRPASIWRDCSAPTRSSPATCPTGERSSAPT